MKKFLVVTALCCMVTVMFIGCKKKDATGGDPNYPITISVFHETGNHPQPAANNPVYQYLKDKLNVTFTWDILVGEIAQRAGTMIAGKQYPDILEIRETRWIDAGALIPLESLVDQYGPRIKALYKDYWNQMKHTDGVNYYFVNYGVFTGVDQSPNYDQTAFWIQKAVLKDAGYPKIATVDEFFNLIENYYRRNPTINGQPTIPFVILTDDWRAFELWNPPNFLSGHANDGNGIVNPATYEYKAFFTMDVSKRWFQKLNELDKRGLIDRASLTDNYDQYQAKIASGRVLGQSVQGWQFMYSADLANRDRGENIRTQAPLPIVFDASIRPHYRNITIPNLYRGMGISVNAKDPVRIIRFINDLLAEDVQRTLNWGIEGQHWQMNAQGQPYRTEQQRANWQNDTWAEQNRARLMDDIFPKIQGTFSDGYPSDLGQYYPEREASLLPEDRELFAAYGVTSSNELMDKNPPPNDPWFPTWNMANPPDGSPAQIALQRCEQTMKQRLPQLILAPTADFERLWTAYVAEMNANGIATYEAFMQESLNQRLKDWGVR